MDKSQTSVIRGPDIQVGTRNTQTLLMDAAELYQIP